MARYQGTAFHESFPGGRAAGELYFTGEAIRFEPEEPGLSPVEWALGAIEIRSGGAADRLVIITNTAAPGWSLQTAQRSILDDEVLSGHPSRAKAHAKRRTHHTVAVSVSLTTLLAVALSFAWLFQKRDTLAAMVVERIPVEWETKLGDAAFKQIEFMSRLNSDAEALAAFKELAEPLVETAKQEGYVIRLYIANDANVNAFALPGGYVVFNSALIEKAGRAAEVHGVLAHEIAHVTQRHSIRNMVRSLGLFFVIQAVVGDVSGVFALLLDNSSLLLSQAYSRSLEQEADEVGHRYLTQAQIDPTGMIDFFQHLKELQGELLNSQSFALLSTHPATQDRINNLRKLTAAAPSTNGPGQNKYDLAFQKLKSKLAK